MPDIRELAILSVDALSNTPMHRLVKELVIAAIDMPSPELVNLRNERDSLIAESRRMQDEIYNLKEKIRSMNTVPMVVVTSEAQRETIRAFPVNAIKTMREITGLGLADAKHLVERARDGVCPDVKINPCHITNDSMRFFEFRPQG